MAHDLLIVEDNAADFALYERLLEELPHSFTEIVHAESIEAARAYWEQHTPCCCLMDYRLGANTADELLRELKQRAPKQQFPVVVSTGQGDERLAVALMQAGALDYLVKDDITAGRLHKSLENAMRTFALQQEIAFMAHHDALTGLLNRSLFMNRLEQAMKEANRYRRRLSLIYLDIDYFKQINDTYGHAAGDRVLKVVAERLERCVRETDSIARLGGDEFVILLPGAASHEGHFVAQKLLQVIPEPIQLPEVSIKVYPSIGIAAYPDTAASYNELIKQADAALYQAKQRGRSQYVKFSKAYKSQWQYKINLKQALPRALERGEVELHYQPIQSLAKGDYYAVEALVRWQHGGNAISPPEIVNLIHQGALMMFYHEWLLDRSIAQLAAWREEHPELMMSVNLPANICHNEAVKQLLFDTLDRYGIPPSGLVIEITETHMMQQPAATVAVLSELSECGINIAIDDFGTGYSSMEYLASLPCSTIKIDQKFLLNWHTNRKHSKIVEAITALGHQLGLKVVAEGIESDTLCEKMLRVGCDYGQGFWLGRPVAGGRDWQGYIAAATQPAALPSGMANLLG